MYTCVYIYIYIDIYVCVCVYIYIYIDINPMPYLVLIPSLEGHAAACSACRRMVLACRLQFIVFVSSMYGFHLHFNNRRFKQKAQTHSYCVFETCTLLFLSSLNI